MQIKNIIALGVFATIANVSCTSMWSDEQEIDIYHCKGGIYSGSSKYYYVFRIDGDKVKITKKIPDFYTYTPQDKQEYIVEGNSDNFVSKLDGLIKNVKCSEVDLREKKEVVIYIPGKSFTYYAKSEAAEQYIDAAINVVLDMYKDKSKITINKRN
ncbi:hypothetical protein [Akkermansia sp. AKK6]